MDDTDQAAIELNLAIKAANAGTQRENLVGWLRERTGS